jgi:hypothetical protein
MFNPSDPERDYIDLSRREFLREAASVAAGIPMASKPAINSPHRAHSFLIKNSCLTLVFNPLNGGLQSFTVAEPRDNYLKAQQRPPALFEVIVGDADGRNQLRAHPTSVSASIRNDTLIIRSHSVRAGEKHFPVSAEVTIHLEKNHAQSSWAIRLHNRDEARSIWGVTFPRIHGVRLGQTWEDDALYFPYWGGERFERAVSDFFALGQNQLSLLEGGWRRIEVQDGYFVRELLYAGGASMMWMDYVDSKQGLYIASYDSDFLVTALRAATRGPSDGSMNFEFDKWITVRSGQEWSSFPTIIAAHGHDWHWAADCYRAWFLKTVPLSLRGGEWRQQVGGWMPFMKNAYGRVGYGFADLPRLWDSEREFGMDLLVPYGWSLGGFDALDPEYYPDLDLGGPVEMSRAYHEIHKQGGQIMTYINARIFNLRSIYFKTLGTTSAVRNADGSYIVESYRPGSPESFAVMCPGSAEWRHLLASFAEVSAREYQSFLIYYDQVGAAKPERCYSTEHGHTSIGSWNRNYRTLLRNANAINVGSVSPLALAIEGAADLYIPHALFQGYFCPLYAGTRFAFPELYKYTFPEAIHVTFVTNPERPANSLYPYIPVVPREQRIHWMCRDIMLGKLFEFMDPIVQDRTWWEQAGQLLALKRSAAPWMAHGMFRDDTNVVSADPSLEVRTFVWDHDGKRSVLVGVLNNGLRRNEEITIDLVPARVGHAFRLGPNNRRCPVAVSTKGCLATFAVPPDLISFTVIEATKPSSS